MNHSSGAIQKHKDRVTKAKVTDPDLVAIRERLLNALAVKASALVTPPATTVSPRSTRTAVPGEPAKRRSSRSRSQAGQSTGSSPRIVVGREAINRLPAELARLHLSAPLIVSSPSRLNIARRIQALIPNLNCRILSSGVVAMPARISGRDCVISVGGGSAVTLARAVGLQKSIPHICVPTTFSASEMAPTKSLIAPSGRAGEGVSSRTSKEMDRESKMLPAVIIYDEDLTMSSPTRFSAPTAKEAMDDFNRAHKGPKSEDARWSYIHLPGV
ncbi:Maleylacetate reductase [Fusarium albosuccineum]|uniref:Maleylacetate reductase n=1 Tax=Fusarium albosuccineum TaxID=1237068 RepID=A0A8H4LL45_9HYPO|nr:Maleylacetate reductase [Fusarium albosuccineum]